MISAAIGIAVCVTIWALVYAATGRFYPFGLLISIGAAVLLGLHLSERK